MNYVVLNVNYPLTAVSTAMNPYGFLMSHSYCVMNAHVLHMHCFMTTWLCLNKRGNVGVHKCNIEACLCNCCCHGKAIIIAYSECVFVTLVIQHAQHICHNILSSVACHI
jgi:hypothetical protein